MAIHKTGKLRQIIFFIAGLMLMVLGIILVLVWWKDVVTVFRGFIGVTIALGGLFVMVMMQE